MNDLLEKTAAILGKWFEDHCRGDIDMIIDLIAVIQQQMGRMDDEHCKTLLWQIERRI